MSQVDHRGEEGASRSLRSARAQVGAVEEEKRARRVFELREGRARAVVLREGGGGQHGTERGADQLHTREGLRGHAARALLFGVFVRVREAHAASEVEEEVGAVASWSAARVEGASEATHARRNSAGVQGRGPGASIAGMGTPARRNFV
jgi:hypothetical protein